MKKVILIAAVLMVLISSFGCNQNNTSENLEEKPVVIKSQEKEKTTQENNQSQQKSKQLTQTQQQAVNYLANYPGKNTIKWADVLNKIDGGENPYIISIQTEEKYNEGHVQGTCLATFGLDLYEKIFYFPIDETVYICSQTGQEAGQAIVLLNMLGIDAYKINGGYNSLKNVEGYEGYVTTEPRAIEGEKNPYEGEVLNFVKQYLTNVSDGKKNMINATKLSDLILADKVQIIDLRSKDAFKEGHIKDAINKPFNKELGPKLDKLSNKRIVVVCANGQKSGQVVAYLKAMARNNTVMLKGGMNAWNNAELPVIK